ncbi:MAG: hypothetical protein AAB913_03175 [Patescibacteria group bacterium]
MKKIIVPVEKIKDKEDGALFLWHGVSRAYRFVNEAYERDETYDYTFSVRQLRQGNTWKSIKDLHRTHPDYDGKGGERDQTMYFQLAYKKEGGDIVSTLSTSLGNGKGKSDKEFRHQVLEFDFNGSVGMAGLFMPYSNFRITQEYKYEAGKLLETVELFKKKGNQEIAFMKNEEVAEMYLKGKFDSASTIFQE